MSHLQDDSPYAIGISYLTLSVVNSSCARSSLIHLILQARRCSPSAPSASDIILPAMSDSPHLKRLLFTTRQRRLICRT